MDPDPFFGVEDEAEREKLRKDLVYFGICISHEGKRVDPNDVFLNPPRACPSPTARA